MLDIERRKPVWWALSDLWLDTPVEDATYNHIVRVMIESGYTLNELAHIYAYEVAPAVYTNMYNIFPGGVWGAFNPHWLQAEILKNIRRQSRSKLYRCWVRSRAGQRLMTGMVRKDWEKVRSLYSIRVKDRRGSPP